MMAMFASHMLHRVKAAMGKAVAATIVCLVAIVAAAPSQADVFRLGDLSVTNANAHPTPKGADLAHISLAVSNAGDEDDVLLYVEVSPTIADAAGFDALPFRVYRGANLRRSRPVYVPAGETLAMGLSDIHVVLYGIHGPFERGLRVPLRLTFARSGYVDILVDVDAPALDSASYTSPMHGVQIVKARQLVGLSPHAVTAPTEGSLFKCQDGGDMVLTFASIEGEGYARVWVGGQSHLLRHQPPEPGPVQIVWSNADSSLTWSPGVQLMWMSGATHLMCGRGGHKH